MKVVEVISRLGGAEATAGILGVGAEAIRKWRQTGAIPARHWLQIVATTGIGLADLPGTQRHAAEDNVPDGATAALVLNNGVVLWGQGFGAQTETVGEVCFNTGMTGYQETLTDPSYAGQIVNFTFPHIGNTGVNAQDMEAPLILARGVAIKQEITEPSSWRAAQGLHQWLKSNSVPGITGIDTRALTRYIRVSVPHGVLSFPAAGKFDLPALRARAAAWPGLAGMDLAKDVSCTQAYSWSEGEWVWPGGFAPETAHRRHVVAVDYGAKRNILRCLAAAGCRVSVVPADTSAEAILARKPDGVFLSNGPGDPAATAEYAVPTIRNVLNAGVPIFGICLGHQLLACALGGRTRKMRLGHRGANQPVKNLLTGQVEITSQNHGFEVEEESLPEGVTVTHRSLFDGSNEGLACVSQRCFSVQYHPEASPGPSDSRYLFSHFMALMGGAD